MASAPSDTVDMSTTSRWAGMLDGAAYHVEVPQNWNGKLVMYAHGYAGQGSTLGISDPSIRRHLIQKGYAWAASSYSKNYYDVRAGVEDTNALALAFGDIAKKNGRTLAAPTKTFIIGHSMGGHIAGAAVEKETLATANHKVSYAGAVPMCGVMGDTQLFDYFAGAQLAAQALTGYAGSAMTEWKNIQANVVPQLMTVGQDGSITPVGQLGLAYAGVIMNLTGGPRPLFDVGFGKGQSFLAPMQLAFGGDGTVDGILNKNVLDTSSIVYNTGDAPSSAQLNAIVQKLTAAPDANRLRTDGLRWIPQVNGEFSVPVVTLHTLGDLFVPFGMEQIYRKRAQAKGSDGMLVQRAIRGITHCDFTIAEQVRAFDDMINWAENNVKPAGDDVLTPATVAADGYGCTFSEVAPASPDDTDQIKGVRALLASVKACPAP
jgi:pimeloyl-ACP methyl ester carboxylesterase